MYSCSYGITSETTNHIRLQDTTQIRIIYIILDVIDMEFPKKTIFDKNDNESSCGITKKELLLALESLSKVPNMKSTAESIITARSESVISAIDVFVNVSEISNVSDEIIASSHDSCSFIWDEDDFLEDALGDELNNTSVTYNDLNFDGTNSDFDASDLMTERDSIRSSKQMDPRSSSTLKRVINFKASMTKTIRKSQSDRAAKIRDFFRLPRRLIQDIKKVIGIKANSET